LQVLWLQRETGVPSQDGGDGGQEIEDDDLLVGAGGGPVRADAEAITVLKAECNRCEIKFRSLHYAKSIDQSRQWPDARPDILVPEMEHA
jgi:hypothetical protein